MPFRRTPVVLAAVAALATTVAAVPAATAAAVAAAPWTEPAAIPGAAPTPAPLIVTGDGRALVFPASDRSNAVTPAGAPTEIVPLNPATGAAAGTPRSLSIASVLAASYARDHYVIAGSTLDRDGTISDKSHVQVAYGTGGGDVGPLKGIPGSTGEHAFALAANDDGVIAIVLGNTTERRLLIRRPNGRGFVQAFQAKVGSQGRGATVAVGAKGDVLMVWENAHHIYARHVGTSGGVGAVHHIGDGVQSHLQAAVESGGRLMAAWVSQRVGEGDASTPATLFFTTAAPGKGFNKAKQIESVGVEGTGRYVSDPAVRLVTGGASLLAWTGYDAGTGHYVVRVMSLSGGHTSTPQTVSDPAVDAVLGDLSVDAAGGAGVVWRTGVAGADPDGASQQAQAALRPSPSQPFGAPETIEAPASGGSLPYAPLIALAPSTGAALAEVSVFGPAGAASPLVVSARPAP
ncbi:MAG TPA: hypothetical protein VFG42_17190 [Baekduia sp.]|uniref:hypothetical protein n=1 Tax=Baekduia sp. TaxID=2600305 RepID=UPI002D77569B|nr:hypothetical protein [Baekduia sp.]HET6508530.1 hypothetical protein [Baekduia sp.]